MSNSIKVEDVYKSFRQNHALRGVSLNFSIGKLHGLIGPEGAGKTTLMRIIMGLLRPDKGQVSILNQNNNLNIQEIREQVAYMPQSQSLYADLSIGEHLEFFRALYNLPLDEYAKRTSELLHITRLENFVDRPAGKLSGGMYKKLGLMCSLLRSPSTLLLDEPTNGVDPISRREFWDLLYKLIDDGLTVIVATAYMDEAERCSQIHILDEGLVIGNGEPTALLNANSVSSLDQYFLKRAAGSGSI